MNSALIGRTFIVPAAIVSAISIHVKNLGARSKYVYVHGSAGEKEDSLIPNEMPSAIQKLFGVDIISHGGSNDLRGGSL